MKQRTPEPGPTAAGVSAEGGERKTRCWCGGTDLEPLRADYVCCRGCGTVAFSEPIDRREYVASGGTGFYGDRYWKRHVPGVLGLPGLEERARSDLAERAVFHLVKILDHLAPGARVLELGCGAGSLTYLLSQAGFDAAGVELGPAAIELARDRFGVEVHRGPLETLDGGELQDAIVGVDLLEHLPDPLATMTLCARRLGPGGRLFLQTPCYRGEGPEWQMLLPKEHLHLFTRGSIERLLRAAGFAAVEIGGSLFPYDMWVAASLGVSLARRPEPLAGVPPVVVALIDAVAACTRAQGERNAVDADRERKQRDVDELRRELKAVRDDQHAKQRLLGRQDRELRQLRGDQGRKSELIDRLDAELESIRGDLASKAELIDRLSAELATVRADQTAKAELIEQLSTELETVRTDQSSKAELIERLCAELDEIRGDQSSKAELIERLGAELESIRGDQSSKAELIDRLSADLAAVRDDQQAKELLIRRLDGELAERTGALEKSRAEVEQALAGVERTRGEAEQVQARLEEIHGELAEIRADRLYRLLRAVRVRLGGRR